MTEEQKEKYNRVNLLVREIRELDEFLLSMKSINGDKFRNSFKIEIQGEIWTGTDSARRYSEVEGADYRSFINIEAVKETLNNYKAELNTLL